MNIKMVGTILLVLVFVATVPAMIQNQNRVREVKKEAKVVLDMSKKICKSGCTDYPKEWIVSSLQTEAELYCMRQCANNMKGIRDSYLEDFPVLYTNQYNFRVAQLYCLLGLACPPIQVTDYVKSY